MKRIFDAMKRHPRVLGSIVLLLLSVCGFAMALVFGVITWHHIANVGGGGIILLLIIIWAGGFQTLPNMNRGTIEQVRPDRHIR